MEWPRQGDLSFVLGTATHLNHNKDVNENLLILFFKNETRETLRITKPVSVISCIGNREFG